MDRDTLLMRVTKPARYVGGEALCVLKDPDEVRLSLALAFPEIYEIAMSHQGLKVLYEELAPRPEIAAERIFMPWTDLMDLMGEEDIAPWSLETGRALGDFDVIGFSLQYELTYTNCLHMLSLAGVPLRSAERGPGHPVVIAGGPCAVNPEPLADFLDLVVVGEAEELIHPLMDLLMQAKEEAWPREKLYRKAMDLEGVYAPALFEPVYQDGRLTEIKALEPEHPVVNRRIVADLGRHQPPTRPVSPVVKPVHDRLGLEIARGCTRGCRFCQAGYIYRPVRERPPEMLAAAAREGLAATGMEELALLSLSSGDYTCIEPLTKALMEFMEPRRWSLSLPSLRADSLTEELVRQIKRVRKSGFTIAPEAGSQTLRDSINKQLSDEEILATARRVYGLGWNLVKLYFMVGLPGETDGDLEAIGELCGQVAAEARTAGRGRGKKPVVHASLGILVPKPHTPFQWEAQVDMAEAGRRLDLAKASLKSPRIKAKWTPPGQSLLEGILARGDRRLGEVLEAVAKAGSRFEGWSEELNLDLWLTAMAQAGLEPAEYLRARDEDETLPWDHIQVGVDKPFLLDERRRSKAGESTLDCRGGECAGCGVCDWEEIEPRLVPATLDMPAEPIEPEGERTVYRFRLAKTGPARFLGHLEMITQLTRGLQRAGAPLAFSQGFHPHPLVKTDSALPLGVESLVESLAVTFSRAVDPDALAQAANAVLPQGLSISHGRRQRPGEGLAEPEEVTYMVRPGRSLDPGRLEEFRQEESSLYLRHTPKGERSIDLKAALKSLSLEDGGLKVVVGRAGGRPKPAEILAGVFGFSPEEAAGARALKIHAQGPAPAPGPGEA